MSVIEDRTIRLGRASALVLLLATGLMLLASCGRTYIQCHDNSRCDEGLVCHNGACIASSSVADNLGGDEEGDAGDTVEPVACDEGPENACGGCETLSFEPGTECGSECGTGEWTCASENTVACVSDSEELNLCGGCEALEAAPGDPCGDCGTWQCEGDGEQVVCDNPDANACGGCEALTLEPGAACGECGAGQMACDGTDATVCTGDPGLNACGACGELAGLPDEACGACGDGVWDCTEPGDSVECRGASEGNSCGGCGPLEAPLGSSCGDCGEGSWECGEGDGEMVCVGAGGPNACGGCGVLDGMPGDPCGEGGRGVFECTDDGSAVVCAGDGKTNECGGTGELPGEIGAVCSCDGEGEARWACTDEGSMVCTDGNDSIEAAESFGTLVKFGSIVQRGYTDRAEDVDWFWFEAIDDTVGPFEPNSTVTTENREVDYRVCIFWEYWDDANPEFPYSCGGGDTCVYYDDATASVRDGECGFPTAGYNDGADLIGCCDDDGGSDASWTARLIDLDDFEDQSGNVYIQVITDINEADDGCAEYTIDAVMDVDED